MKFDSLVTRMTVIVYVISEEDPQNYVPYYRRATVYLAMGKSKSALPDLDKVIELKPDFIAVSSKTVCYNREVLYMNDKVYFQHLHTLRNRKTEVFDLLPYVNGTPFV